MKSNHYKGWKDVAKRAEARGGSVTRPVLAGQDWWMTITLPGHHPYEGDVREVNAFLQGIEAIMPISSDEARGHDFNVLCSYCLSEPFDLGGKINDTCPERGEE
jgi:hypothetical protein